MPSRRKMFMFMAGFSVGLVTCMLISAILGINSWVDAVVDCQNKTGATFGEMKLKYGLFGGSRTKAGCPILVDDGTIKVLDCLQNAGTARIIHILVILFLVFGLLFALLSAIVSFYNSVSNPYENICGPISIYVCSSISGVSTFLAMVLFAANTAANKLSMILVTNSVKESLIKFKSNSDSYGYPFWLILLSMVLCVTTVGITYAYQHANFDIEREQKRPAENATNDVLMY